MASSASFFSLPPSPSELKLNSVCHLETAPPFAPNPDWVGETK